jgi:UDP-glucose 6-dehydrogenase
MYREAAQSVLAFLPKAPYKLVCKAREAEYIKYAGNAFFYLKVVFANLIHNIATAEGCNWEVLAQALAADARIGPSHLKVMHESRPGEKPGRGAGGHCFMKDFAALRSLYERVSKDAVGAAVFSALEKKNIMLLKESGKDLDILQGVYGNAI